MLAETIKTFLRNDDFTEAEVFEDPNGVTWEIKAKKTGIGRFLTARMKSFGVIIEGVPNNFKVSFKRNIGKQYLTQGVVGVGLNNAYQAKLMKFIESTVNSLLNSAVNVQTINEQPVEPNKPFYEHREQNYLRSAQENKTQIKHDIDQREDPIEILKMRLVKGEIDQKEYKKLLNLLQSPQVQNDVPLSVMPTSEETQFWSCPQCYGPIEVQDGKEYCRNCNKFMDS